MHENNGLITSYLLDGKGGGKPMHWQDISHWQPQHGVLWLHLDYSHPHARDWLIKQSGVEPMATDALLAEETRPRTVELEEGLLVILRGVNLNPGADPEDMVAIRVWSDGSRIITSGKRPLLSITDLCKAIDRNRGPRNIADYLVMLINYMSDRASDVIEDLSIRIDDLEEEVLKLHSHQLRPAISNIQREAITFRRYFAPQRDAVSRLYYEQAGWISDRGRMRLRECADQVMRFIEELDSVRERAVVAQEELMSRLSEHMEQRMYVLSLVAAIFLPLGFLTGLLGINVAGIPGADNKYAFIIFSTLLIIIVILQLFIFKRKKWI